MADDKSKTENTTILADNTDGSPAAPASTPLNDVSPSKASIGDGAAALDDLLKEAGGDPTNPDAPLTKTDEEIQAEKDEAETEKQRLADEKAEADKKAGVKPAAAKPTDDPSKTTDTTTPPAEPEDNFKKHTLPPHSKPAVTESFNKLKEEARQEAARLKSELEAAQKKIPTDGSAITPELKKEIDELKAFRAAHDYQNTPEFIAAHVTPIQTNNEAILKRLKDAGYTDAHLAKIKAIGLDKLDWAPVLKDLPAMTQRAIEAKLLENDTLLEKKAAAVEAAQKAPEAFTAKQKEAATAAAKAAETDTNTELEAVLGKVDWAQPKTIPADATASQRAEIESFNKFAKEQADRKALMIADTSPKMRGTLIAAALLAYQFMGSSKNWEARATVAEAELAKIKKSSSTSRKASNAPTTGLPAKNASPLQSGKEALAAFEAEAATRD